MNKSFILLTIIFFYSGFFMSGDKPDPQKLAVLEKLHWIIERSDVPTVRKEFQKIWGSNQFSSIVSGLKDGIYKGSTPEDDYGYRHEISFEMKDAKMISVDYDEIHHDGHAKTHDEEYGQQMTINDFSYAVFRYLHKARLKKITPRADRATNS